MKPLGWTAIGCSFLALAGTAHAQTASQIIPPSFAPPTVRDDGAIVLPESTGAVAPAGSDQVFVQVVEVAIEGDAPVDAVARLKARLVGKRVSVAEVFAAAAQLETALARSGRVLSRIVVPAQTLAGADGGATLRLRVVDGFIERIDGAALSKRVRGRVDALLAPLIGRKDVTLAQIERRLTLAGDVPGLTLSSTIAAGTQFGGTVLIIEGRHRPVSGFLTFDNLLSRDLGRISFGLGVNFNSVLGAGETIYLRASGLPNTGHGTSVLDPTPRNRALAAGIALPLGSDGLSLTTEYTDARLAPRHEAALPGIASHFERLSVRLQYPLARSRSFTLGSDLGLDVQRERVRIFDPANLALSEDRQRVLRGGVDLFARLPGGGYVAGSVKGSFGLDVFNARSAADATPILPLSRAGADASFEKLEFGLDAGQPLASNLSLDIKARAQAGLGQAMSNAEQFGIATSGGISPLPAGLIQGDSGYLLRGELRAPFDLAKIGARLAPYVFGARGGVRLEQPTVFERRRTDASAYGIGARLALPAGITASAEYGRAHIERVSGTANRVTFSVIAQF
ncbi:ShlB/FhaC/HecB family hemolysin secretion/activation protein [Sphingomonas sp. HF-S4]|uniref:ShlB/FhaC/HecB family hemolysin secretion/activation protein n=1 Tax=Sphingomonas agrestis TaxID=3080540 RepID=A0ABU3Y3H0_9SPHN|nr:ShlB/FhaC/HecB family hemolysin secretion/activation protein [Sphingomonas sp. HF-S4]MDV3455893.1 ShlB/FhaC/HecB family hemolysin secretion/activation protein [Sphingomonas sp. HF-S4]